jgi:hypothetical protein
MKKFIGILGVCALAMSACGSDDSGDAAFIAAVPEAGFAGRTMTVVLLGEGTGWEAGATVGFGDGVTVDSADVLATGGILATITIDADAEIGARDVTVNDAVLTGGFELQSPITVEASGTVAQGSISLLTITNHDQANPFDVTSEGDGLFTPITYPNFSATVAEDLDVVVSTVGPYSAELILLADVDAMPGASSLELNSGPAGSTVRSLAGIELTSRSAQTLTADTPATGTLTAAFDSALYELTPGDFSIVDLLVTTTNEDAGPQIALLPASGSFAEMIDFASAVRLPTDQKLYAVVWDNTGLTGVDYSLDALITAADKLSESEDNNSSAMAQATSLLPAVVTDGTLSSVDDEDWFKVTIGAGDVGKVLHVVTMAGDPGTDTVVEVFGANGNTSIGGPSSDQGIHENHMSGVLNQAGTYYVKISASVDWYDPAYKAYDAMFELADAPAE